MATMEMKANLILYVQDQAASTRFYEAVLLSSPRLNVPGMTEFALDPQTAARDRRSTGRRRWRLRGGHGGDGPRVVWG